MSWKKRDGTILDTRKKLDECRRIIEDPTKRLTEVQKLVTDPRKSSATVVLPKDEIRNNEKPKPENNNNNNIRRGSFLPTAQKYIPLLHPLPLSSSQLATGSVL